MSQLIQTLIRDHERARKCLARIAKAASDPGKLAAALAKEKAALLAYLEKEDKEIYLVLEKIAETDSRLKILIHSFSQETIDVTKFVTHFFANPKLHTREQTHRMCTMIETRIKRGETIFYPEFERVVDFRILKTQAA